MNEATDTEMNAISSAFIITAFFAPFASFLFFDKDFLCFSLSRYQPRPEESKSTKRKMRVLRNNINFMVAMRIFPSVCFSSIKKGVKSAFKQPPALLHNIKIF